MKVRSHAVFAVAICIMALPVLALAAPKSIPNLPKTGQASSSVSGLEKNPAMFDFDGRAAGNALAREIGDDASKTRGGAEARLYRRISPSVVLVLTKKGIGSGSLIEKDGTIITNYHVVAGHSEVGILFKPENEGAEPEAKNVLVADVIKVDEVADLALLKLKMLPKKLPSPIALGKLEKIGVGDDVNAIGHPTGETWTYTRGYVSQIRRGYEWKISNNVVHKADVIQTQTPINPGNSGGPLLDTKGAMVGVNSFRNDDSQGLNFAVAISTVQEFLKRQGDRGGNVVATTVMAGGMSQAAAAPQCKPQITFRGRDDKNTTTIVEYDRNCNGITDLVFEKPDDKSLPISVYVDENENDKPEGVILSFKQDEYFNVSYWDSDEDGTTDIVGYHPDGNIKPSSFGPYIASQAQAAK